VPRGGVQLCQAGAEFSLHSFDMNQMMPAATSLITSHPVFVCVTLCAVGLVFARLTSNAELINTLGETLLLAGMHAKYID
jgi:hypothetical protein